MKLLKVLAEEFSLFSQFGGDAGEEEIPMDTGIDPSLDMDSTGLGTEDDCVCQCECPCCQKNKENAMDMTDLDPDKPLTGDEGLNAPLGDDEFEFDI